MSVVVSLVAMAALIFAGGAGAGAIFVDVLRRMRRSPQTTPPDPIDWLTVCSIFACAVFGSASGFMLSQLLLTLSPGFGPVELGKSIFASGVGAAIGGYYGRSWVIKNVRSGKRGLTRMSLAFGPAALLGLLSIAAYNRACFQFNGPSEESLIVEFHRRQPELERHRLSATLAPGEDFVEVAWRGNGMKGYTYRTDMPKSETDDFAMYRHIEGNWYLFTSFGDD